MIRLQIYTLLLFMCVVGPLHADNHLYLGKDWQRLIAISHKYPVSIATNYHQAKNLQIASAGTPRSIRAKKITSQRSSSNYGVIKTQAHQQLMAFKKDITLWLQEAELKLKLNNLSQDRRALLVRMKEGLTKFVLPRIEQNGLNIFHQILQDIATSPQTMAQYQRVNYIGRFLKPEFAQNYKDQKIAFYQTLQNDTLQQLQALQAQAGDAQQIKSLEVELDFVTKRLNKWRVMPIMANMNPIKVFALDEIMGIQNLKDMGFRGRGVQIAIIEPAEGVILTQPHSAFKDRVTLDSNVFSKIHGTHVTGIIVARAETIADRDGVAPDTTISYMPIQLSGAAQVEYGHTKLSESPSIVIDSHANAHNDNAMAVILQKLIAKHIKIVNTSMVYSIGPKTLVALKEFAHEGGIIVKAAGNAGVVIESRIDFSKYKLDHNKRNQTAIDIGLFKAIMTNDELKKSFLIVGNLDSATTLSKSSNQAGFTADRFITAWGTNIPSTVGHHHRSVLSGTSMAAPMVAGAIGLLVQAFPNCGPQNLAQNILNSAIPIGNSHTFGHGRLNLTHAYELSRETCGMPALPQTE